jgi:transposase
MKELIAPFQYPGSTDSTLFEWWFQNQLLPVLPHGKTNFSDNASFHRKSVLREMAAEAKCEVIFIPAYSPDLNPIENTWSWFKSKLREILKDFNTFDDALMHCFHVR